MLSPNTFEHDKLGLKPFCEKLEKFLIIDHDFVEGSLVVALTSPFGTGKSSFLRMWKNDLELRQLQRSDSPQSIILNAWELDYCDDALFAILANLIKAVPTSDPGKLAAIREAASDFGNFALSIANDISSTVGVNPILAGEYAKKKKQERHQRPDFLKHFEDRTAAYERLKKALKEAFGGDSPKAFIFVDELDRCRPDYAISYLETIKHVFDIHGLVFVLSID
jgi:predicted KAP-like P-loop ATPase